MPESRTKPQSYPPLANIFAPQDAVTLQIPLPVTKLKVVQRPPSAPALKSEKRVHPGPHTRSEFRKNILADNRHQTRCTLFIDSESCRNLETPYVLPAAITKSKTLAIL
jgi:hypothetical protein